ncbi:MAG: nitrous oxide reductase accessory protein NosL [Anaerolineae bacterium]|nr:nitrous oxide reductase accessory protein NosL [Anaerolineae bacterium]
MNKRAFLFLLAMLVAALGACGGAESYDKPPEILYGQDVCSNCNMIISEENYASAYWTTNGEARRFDDMGEMLAYMQSNPEERASTWVHDVNTAEWLRAEDAWIVMNAGLMTPMGTGIIAVANEEDAQALAFNQENAMVMTFSELVEKLASGELMLGMGH